MNSKNLNIGTSVEIETSLSITLRNSEIEPKSERNGFLYTGTVAEQKRDNIYRIKLNEKLGSERVDVIVVLKQNNEEISMVNGHSINDTNKITRIANTRPLDRADGG